MRIRRRCAIGDRHDDVGRKESEGSEQADVPFAHGLPFGNPGEGGNAAEPDVVDPSPGLANGGQQGVPAFGFHRWLCARLMKDALHGREAWRRPGKGDHGRRMEAGSQISEAGVFGLRRCLARRNEANVQCLRLDHHARDMAFDQLAVCKDGRRLFPHRCKVPGLESAPERCCRLQPCDSARAPARHNTGSVRLSCSHASRSCDCRDRRKGGLSEELQNP